MEQFSLEKYLANPSRKVVTRNGRNARVISTDMNSKNYPIVALVQISDNYINEEVYTYTKDGEFEAEQSTRHDLFFAPEKHEGWVNLYKGLTTNTRYFCEDVYDSEEEAKKKSGGAIATVKIEWEE